MIKPGALKPGDCIGVISPSSPVKLELFQSGIKYLENQGFRITIGKHSLEKSNGFLAGSEEQRLYDIHQMFRDPNINAIFCSRGGYGSLSLLDKIDYDLIRRNPKIFLGYSDITALHIAIGQNSELVTFHGPMVSDLTEKSPEYNKIMLRRTMMQSSSIDEIFHPEKETKVIYPGRTMGRLTGGNLSLICSTLGTDFEINCKNKILIIEEVGEPSYKIHRMIIQLALAGKLSDAVGFIIGEFYNCIEEEQYPLDKMLEDLFLPYKKPTIYGVKCGHGKYKATLPLGCTATINNDKLIIKERALI